MQLDMVIAHSLKSQEQVLLVSLNIARQDSHSLPEKPRTGIVSRLESDEAFQYPLS